MFRRPVQDRYTVYSVADPALDRGASDVEGYQRTLDQTKLAWRAGERPTAFTLRTPTVTMQARIKGGQTALLGFSEDREDRLKQWVQHSLEVRGLPLRACLERVEGFEGLEELPPREADGFLPASVLDMLGSVELVEELSEYCDLIRHAGPQAGPSSVTEPSAGPPSAQ
jgi:hypothetical protein